MRGGQRRLGLRLHLLASGEALVALVALAVGRVLAAATGVCFWVFGAVERLCGSVGEAGCVRVAARLDCEPAPSPACVAFVGRGGLVVFCAWVGRACFALVWRWGLVAFGRSCSFSPRVVRTTKSPRYAFGRDGGFLMGCEEDLISCALQAWRRPTLPCLETKYHWRGGV